MLKSLLPLHLLYSIGLTKHIATKMSVDYGGFIAGPTIIPDAPTTIL